MQLGVLKQVAGSRINLGAGHVEVDALLDVNARFDDGDRVGLIGHNGSGKSTLLRLIAGLVAPSRGTIKRQGRMVPLLEKGLGINADLTGEENIELPLRLLGASTAEVRAARADIAAFTGLGSFLKVPVRAYSEGMRTRLSFALCTSVLGDILVLDEWLGAGDIEFFDRATARLNAMINQTSIVVLATHNTELMSRVCNKAIWMDRGRVVASGECPDVMERYALRERQT